ncbi:MAG: hypothetical protein MJY42_04780 [Bacteroidales bacterium]|nr:hypothetical protein [Bacteroidales bacterium]
MRKGILIMAALCVCCGKTEEPSAKAVEDSETSVRIVLESVQGFRKSDVFIYDSTPLRRLRKHIQIKNVTNVNSDTVRTTLPEGDWTVTAVADSPWEFNLDALSGYEAFEALEIPFGHDTPERRIQSGNNTLSVREPGSEGSRGANSAAIGMVPLMSSIEVVEIRNMSGCLSAATPGLTAIELYLTDASAGAGLCRASGFRPTEWLNRDGLSESDLASIPNPWLLYRRVSGTAGAGDLYPQVSLYCYPNDAPAGDIASPRTGVTLRGTMNGRQCCWNAVLPAIPRGSALRVGFTLLSEDDFSYEVY